MIAMHVRPALQASAGGINQVFVYGTLKNLEGNHHLLGKNRILKGHARASGFIMVDLGAFPGVVKIPNGGWHIYGEVYEIDDEHLKIVDNLEGYPGFYNREVVDLDHYGKAWIYTLPREKYLKQNCRFIPAGRWKRGCQAYLFDESKLGASYQIDRPLVVAPPANPADAQVAETKGVIVPEKVVKETCQVGPGYEEA